MMMNLSRTALFSMALAATPVVAHAFDLDSRDLREGETIRMELVNSTKGCEGLNQSPHLVWNDPPAGTQSFAITVYDPDAPTGSGWWHWIVLDIPAHTRAMLAGASGYLPAPLVESLTDFGQPGYGGPCPPEGAVAHRYEFTVYAIDVPSLGLDASAMPALAGYMIHAHSLGSVTLTARFGR